MEKVNQTVDLEEMRRRYCDGHVPSEPQWFPFMADPFSNGIIFLSLSILSGLLLLILLLILTRCVWRSCGCNKIKIQSPITRRPEAIQMSEHMPSANAPTFHAPNPEPIPVRVVPNARDAGYWQRRPTNLTITIPARDVPVDFFNGARPRITALPPSPTGTFGGTDGSQPTAFTFTTRAQAVASNFDGIRGKFHAFSILHSF